MLRRLNARHLIKAAAFYKKNGDNYFVFPWAQQGNLRKFWSVKIPAIKDQNYMKWVFNQLLGLADAIQTLHFADTNRTCRHGDLKPENILCFNSSTSSKAVKDHTSCILVISDVGLSRTHDELTKFRSKSHMVGGETMAYAAPETEINPNNATSRRYDIWSLGCIYLEFVIWLLYKHEGLEKFQGEIGHKFYTLTDRAESLLVRTKTAKINPEVKRWIDDIKRDQSCAQKGTEESAVFRLVTLIQKRLLVTLATPSPRDQTSAPSNFEEENQIDFADSQQPSDIPQLRLRAATAIGPHDFHQEGATVKSNFPNAGKNERADAQEVCRELDAIIKDVENGKTTWINFDPSRPEQTSHPVFANATGDNGRPMKGSVGENNEVSALLFY